MKQKILIFLIFIFFLVSFYFILNDNRKLTIIEKIVKEPVYIVQKMFVKKNNINYLNDTLLKEKDKEIFELKKMLDLNMYDYEIINASVINRTASYFYKILTIDKGLDDNISIGDAVITNQGLIGIVVKVSKKISIIKLLTGINKNLEIAVNIENNGDSVFGVMSSYKNGLFKITNIAYEKTINKNSIVTTSGYDNNFPSGLYIGKVSKIKKDKYDLEQIVYIESLVNFDDIRYVAVLKRKK